LGFREKAKGGIRQKRIMIGMLLRAFVENVVAFSILEPEG